MEDWSMKAQIFCQIFGGFPLECTIGQDGKKKFCFSPMACLWSVTLASFQFLASMLWVRELYNMRNLADKLYDHTSRIISTLLIVDGLSMTVMVLVLFQSYNRNHLRFTRVCDVLEVFNTKLNQSTKKANATKKMVGACVVVTALIPIISSILWTNYLEKISLIHNHLYLVILHACMVSTFWAQGVFLVHFSHITQSISSSFTRVTVKMERVVIRNHFRSLLPYQILNHGSDRGDQSSTDGLQSLMNDYWLLCDTVREANTFYSDQLLVIVVSTFLHTTTDLSFFFLSFINKNIIGATDAGVTFLACIFFIVVLAHVCTNVTESADEMTRSVCRLLNMGVEDELQEQLEVFLLQLCNHKVELSASGFFNLNYGTLTSVCWPPSFVDI